MNDTFSAHSLTGKAEPEYKIEHYDVPRYDEHNCYQGAVEGWPVLYRASGNYCQRGARIELSIHRHPILSYTPSGCWIGTWGGKKFVNLRANKQWASTDEAEAIDQLWYRKRKQVQILAQWLQEAEEVQGVLEKHFGKKAPPPRTRYYPDGDYYRP
jgi:hypothetical protein